MPAAPQTELPKPNAITDADKAENRTAFIRDIVGIRPKKKPDEKAGDKPGDKPAEAKPADKPVEVKPVAKKKLAAAKPTPAALSTEDLATAVSTGVREALKPTPEKAKVEPKITDELSDKDKKKYAVFEQMEKNNPENAGLAKKFLDNRRKHEAYQKAWGAKNTGKKFNIADEEHAEFIADNDLTWDDDEYVDALTDIKSNRAASNVEEKFKSRMSESDQQQARVERAREEAPLVIRHQVGTAKILFKELGDEFAKVLGEDGVIDVKEIERLNGANPIYKKVVFPIAQKVEEFAGELIRVARGHTMIREKEPTASEWERLSHAQQVQHLLHKEIVSYATAQEKIFDKLPEDKKLNGRGQMFTTSDKWEKMTAEQRVKHWVLTDRELSSLYATDAALAIKKSIETEEQGFREIAEKRGIKLPDPAAAAVKTPDEKVDKTAEEQRADPAGRRPPPSTVTPRMATTNGDKKTEKNATYNAILGRR